SRPVRVELPAVPPPSGGKPTRRTAPTRGAALPRPRARRRRNSGGPPRKARGGWARIRGGREGGPGSGSRRGGRRWAACLPEDVETALHQRRHSPCRGVPPETALHGGQARKAVPPGSGPGGAFQGQQVGLGPVAADVPAPGAVGAGPPGPRGAP